MERLKTANENSPVIKICSYCQVAIPEVNKAVRARSLIGDIRFNHGQCLDHAYLVWKEAGLPEDKIKTALSKYKPEDLPANLMKNKKLANEYALNIFTKQDLEAYRYHQQQASSQLTERFKKLAGIP